MKQFNFKLLVIEDDEPSRAYYEQIIKPIVKYVHFAKNAFEGIQLFNQHQYDLILTDINMPEMNGLDMIQRIKTKHIDLKFVVMSAYGQSDFFIRAIELGAKGFLLKPVDRFKISALLQDFGKQISLEKEYKKQQEENKKQRALLMQKSKLESLGKLASCIAHEINQPLGGISMGLENILQKIDNKAIDNKYLHLKIEAINGHISRINNILEHIRTFSMIQKDDLKTRFNLNESIHNALKLFKTELQNNKTELTVHLSKEPLFVRGNRFRMEQVIISLINNAIEAIIIKQNGHKDAYQKEISIKSELIKRKIKVCIKDNGIGIDSNNMDKVFDPFFTTKSAQKGGGLGLSVVYGILNDMDGDIRVESEKGKFTEFTLILPIATEEKQDERED